MVIQDAETEIDLQGQTAEEQVISIARLLGQARIENQRLRRALEHASIALESIITDEKSEGRRNSLIAQTARSARREVSSALTTADPGSGACLHNRLVGGVCDQCGWIYDD